VRDTQAIDVCARAFVRGAARASAFALGVVPSSQADVAQSCADVAKSRANVAQSLADVAEPFAFRVQLDTGVAVMFGVLCVLTEDQAATQTTAEAAMQRTKAAAQTSRRCDAQQARVHRAKFGMQHATCAADRGPSLCVPAMATDNMQPSRAAKPRQPLHATGSMHCHKGNVQHATTDTMRPTTKGTLKQLTTTTTDNVQQQTP
jgi:hypothetical protein